MAFTLKDLPVCERPRERLCEFGSSALSMQELLQIILGQGNLNKSVLFTSQQLILKYGSVQKLYAASVKDLCEVEGIGYSKAAQIKAALELGKRLFLEETREYSNSVLSSKQAFQLANYYLKSSKKEKLLLFCLDVRGKLIYKPQTISVGILDCSLVHPREIFGSAIENKSSRILLAHNHPSGSSQPSDQDAFVTRQIYDAGVIIGIPLIDHIIVGNGEFCSLRELKPELFPLQQ